MPVSPTFVVDPLALISAIVAIVGVLLTWRKFREDSLRRGEVLEWSNDCIETFESFIVASILFDRPDFAAQSRSRIVDVAFAAPALVERGRIFFKNQPAGDCGKEKASAYQGFRPRVLDPIVAIHQIAVRFFDSDDETRARLQLLAEDFLRDFVSLVQREIGRERTAAVETKMAGTGFRLDPAVEAIDPKRVEAVQKARKLALKDYRKDAPGLVPSSEHPKRIS